MILYFAAGLATNTFPSYPWILNFCLDADPVSRGGLEDPSGEDTGCMYGKLETGWHQIWAMG